MYTAYKMKQGKLTFVPSFLILVFAVFAVNCFIRVERAQSIDNVFHFGVHSFVEERPCLAVLGGITKYELRARYVNWRSTQERNRKNILGKKRSSILLLIIILGGDVESNPGPVKFPCSVCKRPVAKNYRSVKCERQECHQLVHIKCGGITPDEFHNIRIQCPDRRTVWFCNRCEDMNIVPDLLSMNLPINNSFSALSRYIIQRRFF